MNWSDGINRDEGRVKVSSVRMTSALTTVTPRRPLALAASTRQADSLLASEVGTLFVVSKGLKTPTWNEQRICGYPFI